MDTVEKVQQKQLVQVPLSPRAKEHIKKPRKARAKVPRKPKAKAPAIVRLAWLNLVQSRRKEAAKKIGSVLRFHFESQKWVIHMDGANGPELVSEAVVVDVEFAVERNFEGCGVGYAGSAKGHIQKGKATMPDGSLSRKLTHPRKSESHKFEANGSPITKADYLVLQSDGKAYVIGEK